MEKFEMNIFLLNTFNTRVIALEKSQKVFCGLRNVSTQSWQVNIYNMKVIEFRVQIANWLRVMAQVMVFGLSYRIYLLLHLL